MTIYVIGYVAGTISGLGLATIIILTNRKIQRFMYQMITKVNNYRG